MFDHSSSVVLSVKLDDGSDIAPQKMSQNRRKLVKLPKPPKHAKSSGPNRDPPISALSNIAVPTRRPAAPRAAARGITHVGFLLRDQRKMTLGGRFSLTTWRVAQSDDGAPVRSVHRPQPRGPARHYDSWSSGSFRRVSGISSLPLLPRPALPSFTEGYTSGTRNRRAGKAALALRQLILDDGSLPSGSTARQPSSGGTTVPRLRKKDVERLRTLLLRPDSAGRVIAAARTLDRSGFPSLTLGGMGSSRGPGSQKVTDVETTRGSAVTSSISNKVDPDVPRTGAKPRRAVCLDVTEYTADDLLVFAGKNEKHRQAQEDKLAEQPYTTLKQAPIVSRLPILLSLLESVPLTNGTTAVDGIGNELKSGLLPFGLGMPSSALSLHRPLAGALPTADTLRRGFNALLNAESKVYMYQGPSHVGLHPPTDRLSVFTYWWGFELAMPPSTLEYLSQVKEISTSLLNLLGIIVYAVPGGTRELAPFVGVLSRFIETEWQVLLTQDKGRGVVCGATWFIPAAIVARPWDFEDPSSQLTPSPPMPCDEDLNIPLEVSSPDLSM